MQRVVCRLEEDVADRLARLATDMGISRSELMRRAVGEYIESWRRQRLAEMKAGYRRMAATNLHLAEESFEGTEADWSTYEETLVEGDRS